MADIWIISTASTLHPIKLHPKDFRKNIQRAIERYKNIQNSSTPKPAINILCHAPFRIHSQSNKFFKKLKQVNQRATVSSSTRAERPARGPVRNWTACSTRVTWSPVIGWTPRPSPSPRCIPSCCTSTVFRPDSATWDNSANCSRPWPIRPTAR